MAWRSRSEILCGTDEPVEEARVLSAGPLRAEFSGGNLRYVSWHGYEALRAIAYLVRDENWGTYAPEVSGLAVEEEECFRLRYRAACRAAGGAVLSYQAEIEGRADGRLTFDVTAVPDRDFLTNRCGFCILHPIVGVAGSPAEVEHVDGSIERAVFPERIEPAQPFFDIRAISHQVAPGVTATCRMEGDAFEMEDQRNWSDASYKTYVRPLALPWPYTLPAGEPVRQTITLTLAGTPAAPRLSSSDEPVSVLLGEPLGALPEFGLSVTPEETPATIAAIARLEEIASRHLVLHYNPLEGHGLAALAGYAELLSRYPVAATMEFVLPCRDTPENELKEVARLVAEADLPLAAVAVSPAPDLKSTPPGSKWPECPALEEVYRAARRAFPGIALGGGMFSYFTELNRKRLPAELLDFITHTTAPIVHAADDRSVMETLEALPFITRSVRAIFGDKPYRIGPSTIGMRHNPYGAKLAENASGRRRMTMVADDPRQRGLFAAAWMVGYAAAVAPARLDMLTLGALTGRFGLLDGNGLRPAFHAARAIAALSGLPGRDAVSSDPRRVLAVCGGNTVVVANLGAVPVSVRIPGMETVAVLDEDAAEGARRATALPVVEGRGMPFMLGAYGMAVARIGDGA